MTDIQNTITHWLAHTRYHAQMRWGEPAFLEPSPLPDMPSPPPTAPTPSMALSDPSSGGLPGWAIVLVSVAATVVVLAAAGVFVFWAWRRRKHHPSEMVRRHSGAVAVAC